MARRSMDMQRKRIEQERDRLLDEIEALRNQVTGLETALALLGKDEQPTEPQSTSARGKLRSTLEALLREAGTSGLNATSAVEVGQRRGIYMDKQSVSSTLSRMKRDGLLDYSGDRYRLVQFLRTDQPKLEVVN